MNRVLSYAEPSRRGRWSWLARYFVAFLLYSTLSNGSHSLIAETRRTPFYRPTRLLFLVSGFPASLMYDRASRINGPPMSGPTPPDILLNPWAHAFMYLSVVQMLLVPLLMVYCADRLREWWLFDAPRHKPIGSKAKT